MLYKHLFSILCGHLNLNNFFWIWPVTRQTGRYTGQTDRYTDLTYRYTGTNRLNWEVWIQIWIWPVPTGNRPNRTGIPEPESSGLAGPVGKVNPDWDMGISFRILLDRRSFFFLTRSEVRISEFREKASILCNLNKFYIQNMQLFERKWMLHQGTLL